MEWGVRPVPRRPAGTLRRCHEHDDTDGADGAPRSLFGRLKALIVKPPDPNQPHLPVAPEPTLEELEEDNRRLDDHERMIGLAIAPLAAVLAFVLVAVLVSHNPPAEVNGQPNPEHVTIYPVLELRAARAVGRHAGGCLVPQTPLPGRGHRPLWPRHLQPALLGIRRPVRDGRAPGSWCARTERTRR